MDGDGDGGRWLTYAQLAEMRGITRKAAIRMTQRHRWRRQPGNDGTALVWVPYADLTPRQLPSRQTERQPARQPPDGDGGGDAPGASVLAGALAALEGAVAGLREQLERAEAGRADASARAERAEKRIDELRTTIDELKAGQTLMTDMHAREFAVAQDRLERVQDAAEAIRQAEAARQARGRLRRAWDGWRGR
jgi:hypothetical protein